jgi:hypothetical protein
MELYLHFPDIVMACTFILFCATGIKCLCEAGTEFKYYVDELKASELLTVYISRFTCYTNKQRTAVCL